MTDFIKAILQLVLHGSEIAKESHFQIQGIRIRNEQTFITTRQQGIIQPITPPNIFVSRRIPLALESYKYIISYIKSDTH